MAPPFLDAGSRVDQGERRDVGQRGKREYVQVLRLMETFRLADIEAAVRDAIRLGPIGFDAIKHLVLCRIERKPPRLDLDVYPYLL